ncbi:MAG TPA: NAD-dependent epimerase/dehydratase family protein, partial [Propionibacteriaceae bacterium]
MKFLLAGASGFLGSALRVRLAQEGHEVVRLVRREPATATEIRWDPDAREVDLAALRGVDVVVNLCGAGVADQLWTESRRRLILSSRVNPTSTLATALAAIAARGEDEATPALIQASGISRYGTGRRDTPADEETAAAADYLSDVVVQWEGAAQPAVDAGVRVIFLRTSPVMDASGGPLRLMKLPWSFGAGA